jgi:hypothetical protein
LFYLWLNIPHEKIKNRTFLFPGNKIFSATGVESRQIFEILIADNGQLTADSRPNLELTKGGIYGTKPGKLEWHRQVFSCVAGWKPATCRALENPPAEASPAWSSPVKVSQAWSRV